MNGRSAARRKFLKFLAASPYVASLGGIAAFASKSVSADDTPTTTANLITDPSKALDVFDFEEPAHNKVSQAHWAYMASGVDNDITLHANRDGYKHIELR